MSRSLALAAPMGSVFEHETRSWLCEPFQQTSSTLLWWITCHSPNQTKSKQDYQIIISDDLYEIYIPKTDLRFYQRLAHFIANSPNPAINLSSTNLPRPISPPCNGKRYSQYPAS
jgi:hypothetical protein